MNLKKDNTSIKVKKETLLKLKLLKGKKETMKKESMDDIILKLIKNYRKKT